MVTLRFGRGRVMAILAAVLATLAVTACGGSSGPLTEGPEGAGDIEADYEYTILLGTSRVIAAGGRVEIMPAELTVHVGEVLRIVNQDVQPFIVGPFFVGAGETLTQRFSRPGTLEGECVLQASGQFVINIVA